MVVESIVNLAVGKIGELLVNEAKFLYGVKDEVKSIQQELMMMNSFLIDMDTLDDELGDERTRTTAKEIRSIACEAEDVIETYILEANPDEYKKSSLNKYLCFFKCLVTTHQVGGEIGDIKTKIAQTMDMLTKYRGEYGFPKAAGKKGLNKNKGWRPASYAHTKEDHVVGINEDINRLVGSLTTNETQIQVLLIVGMGGCGKTTLTRKLYNHESIKQCFDTMAWVSISQKWVAHYGLLDILKEISGETMQLDVAQGHQAVVKNIYKYLERRKYLIVLDDVWTKEALEEILPALPFVDNGSKIIVTTRSREVVDDPTLNISIHEPRKLTKEESWELFGKIALNHGQETVSSEDPEFEDFKALGKEMLKKCDGLPLAVVALAGLLAKKKTIEEWRKVKVAMSSRMIETGRGTHAYGAVKDMLTLSYNDLSRDLKPCFLYLGLFPEDCQIPAGMLIRMWIAEGFISPTNLHVGETLEDLARKYLDELIGRCVVRVARRNYDGRAKEIEIHDLMRDLCISKAKEQDFLETLHAGSSDPGTRLQTQPRRTAVHSYDDKVFFPFSTENPHLRSLFLFATPGVGSLYANVSVGILGDGVREERSELSLQPILKNMKLHRVLNLVCINTSYGTLPNEIGSLKQGYREERSELSLQPILKNLKLLRVLNLVCIDTSDCTLPNEIGTLIHLRYFGLRVTNISGLPSSIGNLRNLLTLDYRRVVNKEKEKVIPNVVWKIKGIRHLYLSPYRAKMEGMRFDSLQHLQTLWVGGGSWVLDQVPKLSITVRKLYIQGIESNEELEAVFRCPSIMSDRLHKLRLDWNYYVDPETKCEGESDGDEVDGDGEGDGDGETVLRNLEVIVNSQHLRKLRFHGRIDDRSTCCQFPFGIKRLYLQYAKLEAEATLEALGRLPNLQHLSLMTDSYIGTKWTCYEGMFSQLKFLWLSELPNLEEWTIERGATCQLKELHIYGCKRFRRFPEGLKFITTLKELNFRDMTEEFYNKIREDDGEDYHIIQHIPLVRCL